MTRITEKVFNIKDEITALAAAKNHTHPEYLQNTSDVTYLTNAHSSKQATSATLGHVIVDASVKDNSDNPVSNKAIKEYVDAIPKITLDSTVTADSTNGVTSGAVFTALDNIKYDIDITGLSPTKPSQMALNDFDGATTPGSYRLNANIPMKNKTNINTKSGILTILKMGEHYMQILNLPNGNEYRRGGVIPSNGEEAWDSWKLSYMPFQPYTAPLANASYNNNVHDIEIFQDTAGYTIRWNQTKNPDTNQTYFLSHQQQYEYKHVVKFSTHLEVAGEYVFGSIGGTMDIKIQNDGIYLRSSKANSMIRGINQVFFVPRVP